MESFNLHTSLRTVPAEKTWDYLKNYASAFGVTRITNTTLLDKIGVPVYAAIRPTAQEGSLCVSSGKALSHLEAKVGALTEAIELASAEFDQKRDSIFLSNISSFEKQFELDIFDFCVLSKFLKRIPPETEIDLVEVREYFSGRDFLIPATLVFVPYKEKNGPSLFGQSSNGISGGNSHYESLLHATLEVLERDTLSFSRVGCLEQFVLDIDTPYWRDISNWITSLGLRIYITFCENLFKLPMFICYLFDDNYGEGVCVTRGQGLHLDKNMALLRAITEAIQSRLTNIHGGRDDIIKRFIAYQRLGMEQEVREFKELEGWISKLPRIEYQKIYTNSIQGDIEVITKNLLSRINNHGFKYLFYSDLTKNMISFHVLKVIIPSMEFYSPLHPRIGKRLLNYVTHNRG